MQLLALYSILFCPFSPIQPDSRMPGYFMFMTAKTGVLTSGEEGGRAGKGSLLLQNWQKKTRKSGFIDVGRPRRISVCHADWNLQPLHSLPSSQKCRYFQKRIREPKTKRSRGKQGCCLIRFCAFRYALLIYILYPPIRYANPLLFFP